VEQWGEYEPGGLMPGPPGPGTLRAACGSLCRPPPRAPL